MINPIQAMANFIKKFRRKRRLSSELDTRWGDPAISYPNQGSWNQWDQPSGSIANAATDPPRDSQSPGTRHYLPLDSVSSHNAGASSDSGYQSFGLREDHAHVATVIPKGYFDENIVHRGGRSKKPGITGLGINAKTHQPNRMNGHLHADDSCDEDEEQEGRDTLGHAGAAPILRNPLTGDQLRYSPRVEQDPSFDGACKSPPLSVTQRMRRLSQQSSTTEPSSSVAGTASSRRTSYTAASSVSAPSLPPDTPRFAFGVGPSTYEKRSAPRPRHREPETMARQEMVPSYDELYG